MITFRKILSHFLPKPKNSSIVPVIAQENVSELHFSQIPFFNADFAVRPSVARNDLKEAFRYMDGKPAIIALLDALIIAAPGQNFQLFFKIRDEKFKLANIYQLTGNEIKSTLNVEVTKYYAHRYIKEMVLPQLNTKILSA